MSDEEKYTEREFSEKFEELRWNLLNAYRPTLESPPQAFLLGGQSGAGKTTLHKIIHRRLDGNGISINGDDYRKFHPRFLELQRIYGDEAVNYTAPWAGRMTEALIDSLSRIGYNLVIESTLRTAEVPLKTAELLRQRGYGVSLRRSLLGPEMPPFRWVRSSEMYSQSISMRLSSTGCFLYGFLTATLSLHSLSYVLICRCLLFIVFSTK